MAPEAPQQKGKPKGAAGRAVRIHFLLKSFLTAQHWPAQLLPSGDGLSNGASVAFNQTLPSLGEG